MAAVPRLRVVSSCSEEEVQMVKVTLDTGQSLGVGRRTLHSFPSQHITAQDRTMTAEGLGCGYFVGTVATSLQSIYSLL